MSCFGMGYIISLNLSASLFPDLDFLFTFYHALWKEAEAKINQQKCSKY